MEGRTGAIIVEEVFWRELESGGDCWKVIEERSVRG